MLARPAYWHNIFLKVTYGPRVAQSTAMTKIGCLTSRILSHHSGYAESQQCNVSYQRWMPDSKCAVIRARGHHHRVQLNVIFPWRCFLLLLLLPLLLHLRRPVHCFRFHILQSQSTEKLDYTTKCILVCLVLSK